MNKFLREHGVVLLLVVLLALLVFRSLLESGMLLATTDDNIGALALAKAAEPYSFFGYWNDSSLLGGAGLWTVDWTSVLLYLLPVDLFSNWIHALDLALASLFLALFLFEKGLSPVARAAGLIAAYWLGSNFTLTYAGHIGKFALLFVASFYLWAAARAARTGSLALALVAGGALGELFQEMPDIALFFAMILGPYYLFELLRVRRSVAWLTKMLLPLGIMAALFAIRPVWEGFRTSRGVAPAGETDPRAQWEFITQWSWPPEECIDFIAPGFMGWRSGEPEGPYWGRMGRSAGWEQTHQGFQNFKLENQYLGAIPVVLAIVALLVWLPGARRKTEEKKGFGQALGEGGKKPSDTAAERRGYNGTTDKTARLDCSRPAQPGRPGILDTAAERRGYNGVYDVEDLAHGYRAEVWFWGSVALLTLLLAFGKYFPLYQLFYQLPVVSSIRNPNKFLQIFQLAVGILAAYGLDALLRTPSAIPRAHWKRIGLGVLAVGVILLLAALGSLTSTDSLIRRFAAEGWGQYAPVIVNNRSFALLYGGVMIVLAAGAIAILTLWERAPGRLRRAMPWALVALTVGDVLFLSRHYVKTMPASAFEANDVVRLLKSEMPEKRAALVTQEGFYNYWLTYLFPYHDIRTLNVTQMPRMPEEYKRFLGAFDRQPLRLWQLAAVRFVLGPAGLWNQVSHDPAMKDAFELALAYNVAVSNATPVYVPASPAQPGQHCVLKLKATAPRFAVVGRWRETADDDALRRLADPAFPLFDTALVAPEHARDLPPSGATTGLVGTANMADYRAGRMRVQTSTTVPALLRLADKYDPDWKATVNGKPTPVRRVDYLFMGVMVEPGINVVELRYAPNNWTLYFQAAGLLICLGAIGVLVVGRVRRGGRKAEE